MANQLTTKIDKGEVTRLCADAISELERAARLHPQWPAELHYREEYEQEETLHLCRYLNDNDQATGTSIFSEEFLEFLLASRVPGNQVAARIELVQALAMLLRIGCHLDDYMKHAATKSTEVTNA